MSSHDITSKPSPLRHCDWDFPYRSGRMPVLARNVVATSQPLAAQAGLQALVDGGNAVDAALTAAITLTVVEPTGNGIGSDAFAMVWDGTTLHGLNASGRSPAGWTPDVFAGRDSMPIRGWGAVTVPGAVSGWVELHRRFGKLPFERLCAPAIRYAREGFAVSPLTAKAWARSVEVFADSPGFLATFAPQGRAPRPGELFRCPNQARTLEQIAETRGEAFYRGALADRIVADARSDGALLDLDDLSGHRAEWVEPLGADYAGTRLLELPPNGQGLAALLALRILRHHPVESFPPDSADAIHLQIEAMKLALADTYRHVADPEAMRVSPLALLDEAYCAERSQLIDPLRAQDSGHGEPRPGGTVYLAAADAAGMMVSMIQSNYLGFGSGVVVPGTGIAMQNRGHGFVLTRGHPNRVGPRKRPFHTIIPAFVMQDGQPLMALGVMGGAMQAQGHVQVMTRVFSHRQNPQAALDAPRWRVMRCTEVIVEEGFPSETLDGLRERGHQIRLAGAGEFGGGQVIYRTDAGCLGASDWRKDGQAVGL